MLVAAIVTIVLLFIPIGYIDTDQYQYIYTCFQVKLNIPDGATAMSTIYIAFLLIISAILSVVSILQYKDRMKQIKINSINMIIFLIAIMLMIYIFPDVIFVRKGLMRPDDFFNFNYWIMVFIIPAVCLFLANRATKKDEKKVKAADRLR